MISIPEMGRNRKPNFLLFTGFVTMEGFLTNCGEQAYNKNKFICPAGSLAAGHVL